MIFVVFFLFLALYLSCCACTVDGASLSCCKSEAITSSVTPNCFARMTGTPKPEHSLTIFVVGAGAWSRSIARRRGRAHESGERESAPHEIIACPETLAGKMTFSGVFLGARTELWKSLLGFVMICRFSTPRDVPVYFPTYPPKCIEVCFSCV